MWRTWNCVNHLTCVHVSCECGPAYRTQRFKKKIEFKDIKNNHLGQCKGLSVICSLGSIGFVFFLCAFSSMLAVGTVLGLGSWAALGPMASA